MSNIFLIRSLRLFEDYICKGLKKYWRILKPVAWKAKLVSFAGMLYIQLRLVETEDFGYDSTAVTAERCGTL